MSSEVQRERYSEAIPPRGDSHIVLGAARSLDVLKTFVEPGGSFSPGLGSFGVSIWVWLPEERRLVTPELLPREAIRDRMLGGLLPVHRSRWRAGPLELDLRLGVEACPDAHHPLDTLLCRAVNRGQGLVQATVLLVVRGPGPAGGPLRQLAYSPEIHGFLVDDTARVIGSQSPSAAGCVAPAPDGADLTAMLRRGELPTAVRAHDKDGHCGGCLAYEVTVEAGGEWSAWWDFPVLGTAARGSTVVGERCRIPASDRLDSLADDWREQLTRVSLTVPDGRVAEAFHASLTHLLMAFNGDEPRIATVCYPLFWIRDSVYILNALDKAGLADWTRPAMTRLATELWSGGFGPEADSPGQALWALGEHFLLTRDVAWLREIYPGVRERAGWIERMRTCRQPIRVPVRDVLPRTRLHPEQDLVCEAAVGGLIIGRMDWHRPLFWVNAFALAGLRAAAAMAAALGEDDDAVCWAEQANGLAALLHGPALQFGRNDRDVACAIWPTGARAANDPAVHEAFERWWHQNRYDDKGIYRGEPRWRYFELGQAHNLLRLGMRERALLTLEQFLRTQDAPGLYAWAEGDFTGDPSGDWRLLRSGWRNPKIMPHGWASAEMALLIRAMMVYEHEDQLVLGAGVRPEWLRLEEGLGIEQAPTHHGRLSWRLDPVGTGRFTLTIACEPGPPPGGYRLRLPLPPSAIVEHEGAGIREEAGDWPIRTGQREIAVGIVIP